MRTLTALVLVACLALAGCASKGGGDGDADGTASQSSTKSASGSSSSSTKSGSGTSSTTATGTGSSANQAPEARLSGSTAGGALPLQVNFTLNGTDADGDSLTWTLAFGDGSANATGTTFAPVAHNFTAAGVYNVTLNVTDGKAFGTASVSINVTAAAASGAGQVAELAWDVGVAQQASPASGNPFLECTDGPNKTFNYDSFQLDLATRGLPFKATISALSGDPSIHSWKIFFNLEDCSDYAGDPPTATGAADITGIVPEDAGPFVFVMATGGFLLESTFQSGSQITA